MTDKLVPCCTILGHGVVFHNNNANIRYVVSKVNALSMDTVKMPHVGDSMYFTTIEDNHCNTPYKICPLGQLFLA